jgi:hypothetical protein
MKGNFHVRFLGEGRRGNTPPLPDSGTVESGINTVVHHRMKRPGRGWGRSNGQAMLAGLSELHSGRFDQAWQATLPLAA